MSTKEQKHHRQRLRPDSALRGRQNQTAGANAQPYYVLVDNAGLPLAPWYAFDEDVDKYVRFLLGGMKKYK